MDLPAHPGQRPGYRILVHLVNDVAVAEGWAVSLVALVVTVVVTVPAAVSLHRGPAGRDRTPVLS